MSVMNGRYDVTIMGVKIGTCKSFVIEDTGDLDIYIQADDFVPDALKTQAPPAEIISFHFISGKFKVWNDGGDIEHQADIFAEINGA